MAFLANLFQPSTVKGIATIGASIGLYSVSVVNPIVAVAAAVYGLVDVFRDEYKAK